MLSVISKVSFIYILQFVIDARIIAWRRPSNHCTVWRRRVIETSVKKLAKGRIAGFSPSRLRMDSSDLEPNIWSLGPTCVSP